MPNAIVGYALAPGPSSYQLRAMLQRQSSLKAPPARRSIPHTALNADLEAQMAICNTDIPRVSKCAWVSPCSVIHAQGQQAAHVVYIALRDNFDAGTPDRHLTSC
ncbi:hypothetical protein VMCG_05289 [Cytospora schulzeri]|uniref:Uncharacterized protein n=1 Tax=Cytospora schulzeri TaxID=448051 RepID=A0A423WQS6_9PEZI|nr:hypothetical protein VMCG_05289 [Valsa malicola]